MNNLTEPLLPLWRSLLFVPANNERFVLSSIKRYADAIVLDLEDSVPDAEKMIARQQIPSHLDRLADNSNASDVIVRVNHDLMNLVADLNVSVQQGVSALMLSKTMGADHVHLVDESLATLEIQRQIPVGTIKLIAMIESIDSLGKIDEIAQSSTRLVGLAIGTEDLALDGGFEPTSDNLNLSAQMIVYAARRAKLNAYGFPGSIANYSDAASYIDLQVQAKSMGFNGALCIHPNQVKHVNAVYTVTNEELLTAKEIVAAYNKGVNQNLGAVAHCGKMIDAPVVNKALRLIERFNKQNKQAHEI